MSCKQRGGRVLPAHRDVAHGAEAELQLETDAHLRKSLGSAYASAHAAGSAMTVDGVIDFALASLD